MVIRYLVWGDEYMQNLHLQIHPDFIPHRFGILDFRIWI
jgi:hypothetical protein